MEQSATSSLWQSSRGAGRSRIVVDLQQQAANNASRGSGSGDYLPPGGSRPRRGCLRRVLGVLLLITLLVVLAAFAGSYLWWRGFRQSPVYSLALIADAAQRDDRQTFDELVDAAAVTRAFLPQVRQQATGSTRELPAAVERQVSAAVERQLPNIEGVVRDRMRTTIADAARQAGGKVPFPLLALAMRGLTSDVQETNDTANLKMRLGGEEPTELTMRRQDQRWQVIGVKDARIAASLAGQLPTALPNSLPGNLPNLPPGTREAIGRELQRRKR